MTLDRRSLLLSITACVATTAGLVLLACSSSDEAEPTPPSTEDAGDAATSDAAEAGYEAGDAAPAPDVLVDAAAPVVTCATTPCAVEIVAGFDSACVRMDNGTVRCWGSNGAGELGRGEIGGSGDKPAPVVGLTDAIQISGSASQPSDVYCALRSGGSAVCWGSNDNGVLGRLVDGEVDTQSSANAEPVMGLAGATGIFAGALVSCATVAGNDVACWGANTSAQIPAHPREEGKRLPTTTFSLAAKASRLAVSDRGTVALTGSSLLSWGLAGAPAGPRTGVLGREASTTVSLPEAIDLGHVSAVTATTNRVCGIANGRVYCWGVGPTAGGDSVYPTYTGVGTASVYALTLAVGPRSACATMSDGTAFCWGDNARGQLGAGNVDPQLSPIRVQKLGGKPVRMAVMESAACALLEGGSVQCWGLNDKGQLGTGSANARPHLEPQNVVLTP